MADFADFLPLYVRTEEDIRNDFDVDANAGLSVGDPDWVDTRAPGFFYTVTQPFVIEAARIHDYISTIPAVAFVQFAFGEYLDYHAEDLNTERIAAVAASGIAHFTGAAGTTITAGTLIGAPQVSDAPPIIYAVTQTVQIPSPLGAPPAPTPTITATGGTLSGDRYYALTAYTATGETLPSAVVHVSLSGATNKITFSWPALAGAIGYWLYEGASSGALNQAIQVVGATNYVDSGSTSWVARTPPTTDTSGGTSIDAPIQAQEPGTASNVGVNALTLMISFNPGISAVTNVDPITNGVDVESDAALKTRLLGLLQGQGEGPGTQADYIEWALDYPGVGQVYVIPSYGGPGGVGVVIMDTAGNPLASSIVAGLQAQLDPYPGQGGGIAPIDHIVTVLTPTLVPVNIAAAVTFAVGYSYDGASNTIPIRQSLLDALAAYLATVQVGQTVLLAKLKAIFFTVEGVANVNVTAPAGDVTTTTTPPQRAALGTMTLS